MEAGKDLNSFCLDVFPGPRPNTVRTAAADGTENAAKQIQGTHTRHLFLHICINSFWKQDTIGKICGS